MSIVPPIDTDARLLDFLNQFIDTYIKLKLNQPYLNTDDILKILGESLNSSVAFVSLPKYPNRFQVKYLYLEESSYINLTPNSEFEFSTEILNWIQAGNPSAWEEDDVQKNVPDLYNLGIRNLFAIQYRIDLDSYPQILIVGNRKKRPQGEAVFYVNQEAKAAKVFMGLADREIQFHEHLKSYKNEIRRSENRTAVLKATDDFLKDFDKCFEKNKVLDEYLFKSLDLQVALQVRPSKIANPTSAL